MTIRFLPLTSTVPATWECSDRGGPGPALFTLPGRPGSPAGRGLLVAVNLASVAFFLLSYSRHGVGFGPYRIDLDVYRLGSQAWLHGANLYGALPPTSSGAGLPFSYPPVAAMLLAPLAMLPMTVATTALTLATIALAALVLRLFLRNAAAAGSGSWWTVGWLLPAALFLEPVRNTLNYGQVNVALMALVALDCLTAAPRWRRGVLVGVAAAVKLTPAAFVLFFLLRRDWRAARAAAGSFAVSTGAGFLFGWRDSVAYWTSVVFQAGRPAARSMPPISRSRACWRGPGSIRTRRPGRPRGSRCRPSPWWRPAAACGPRSTGARPRGRCRSTP